MPERWRVEPGCACHASTYLACRGALRCASHSRPSCACARDARTMALSRWPLSRRRRHDEGARVTQAHPCSNAPWPPRSGRHADQPAPRTANLAARHASRSGRVGPPPISAPLAQRTKPAGRRVVGCGRASKASRHARRPGQAGTPINQHPVTRAPRAQRAKPAARHVGGCGRVSQDSRHASRPGQSGTPINQHPASRAPLAQRTNPAAHHVGGCGRASRPRVTRAIRDVAHPRTRRRFPMAVHVVEHRSRAMAECPVEWPRLASHGRRALDSSAYMTTVSVAGTCGA